VNAEGEVRPGTVRVRGEAVKRDRDSKGWTQEELAAQAGVSQWTVSRVENNGRVFLSTLGLIAAALGWKDDVRRYIAEERVLADEVRPAAGASDAQVEQRRKERALLLGCEWSALTAEHRAAIEERMPGSVAQDKALARNWMTAKRAQRIYHSRLGQKG